MHVCPSPVPLPPTLSCSSCPERFSCGTALHMSFLCLQDSPTPGIFPYLYLFSFPNSLTCHPSPQISEVSCICSRGSTPALPRTQPDQTCLGGPSGAQDRTNEFWSLFASTCLRGMGPDLIVLSLLPLLLDPGGPKHLCVTV